MNSAIALTARPALPQPLLMRMLAALTLILGLMLAQTAAAQTFTMTEGEGRPVSLPQGASSVFVADPSIADAQAGSPNTIYLSALSAGQTSIIVSDASGATLVEWTVAVRRASGGAAAVLGGNLQLNQNGDMAVISGNADTVNRARGVSAASRSLQTNEQATVIDNSTYTGGGEQVSLRVRFVEASRSDLLRLGVNLSALGNSTSGPLRVTSALGNPTGFLGGAAATDPSIGGRISAGGATIDALIDALERRGAVQILSEPTLTTVSGQSASFRAGGEFAYPVNQGDGVTAAAFKEYGVAIDFTPIILPNRRIAIQVSPEVSFIDAANSTSVDGFTVPGLSVRRVSTNVEVGSGQTFAIAGLYEQFSENNASGPPGMTRVLGRNSQNRRERELMIFITPYLTSARDVAQPRVQRRAPQAGVGFIVK